MNGSSATQTNPPAAGAPRARPSFWRLADYSLRAKLLIAFLAVSLIPLGVLALVNFRSSQQALTDAANKTLLGVASQTALSLDSFFDNTRGVVQTESQLPAIRQYLSLSPDARAGSDLDRELKRIVRTWWLRDTRARSYLLLDATGVVVLSTSSLDLDRDLSKTDFFQQTMNTGQSYVSDVLFEPRAMEGDIYFSMVVRDAGLNTLGVLVARYTARAVQTMNSAIGVPNGHSQVLEHSRGRAFAHAD